MKTTREEEEEEKRDIINKPLRRKRTRIKLKSRESKTINRERCTYDFLKKKNKKEDPCCATGGRRATLLIDPIDRSIDRSWSKAFTAP